ncbi:hypothetical protein GQ457_14G023560 [Hibiscus cannabinus]
MLLLSIKKEFALGFGHDYLAFGMNKEERLVFACLCSDAPHPSRVVGWVTSSGTWDWSRLDLKIGGSAKSSVFIWSVFHERLLTNVERVRRHIATSALCEICGDDRKDVEHVLRSCFVTKGLWLRLLPLESRTYFFSISFHAWLCKNLFDSSFMSNDGEWVNRFAIMCWLLWKRSCWLLLASEVGVLNDVLVHRNRLTMECSIVGDKAREPRYGRCLEHHWNRPSVGYRWVELESNCLEAVRIVNSRSDVLAGSALMDSIRRLLSKDWEVVVTHIGPPAGIVSLVEDEQRIGLSTSGIPTRGVLIPAVELAGTG